MVVGCRFECSQCGVAAVGHDAQITDFAAQSVQQSPQEKAIGVVDGACGHVLRSHITGHHQFIARREQGHAWTLHHTQLSQSEAGSQTQFSRPQLLATAQSGLTLSNVFATAANPLTDLRLVCETHTGYLTVCHQFGLLLHHDGIGTQWHRCAGENACHLTWLQSLPLMARGNALGHRQLRPGQQVSTANGVPVHGRIVEGRHLQ
jgi:hypothetical protein